MVVSTQRFLARPRLIFLNKQTNLFAARAFPPQCSALQTLAPEHHHHTHSSPDFASDSEVLCKLLAWRFSDDTVSVVIHKVGDTLVLLQGRPPRFSDLSSQDGARSKTRLISGFDVLHPRAIEGEEEEEEEKRDMVSTSMEEERRLRLKANSETLQDREDNGEESELDQALHMLSGNASKGNVYQLHAWDFNIMLKSRLRVYNDDALTPCSLILRDTSQPALPRKYVIKLFLDNLLAGVAKLNVCLHRAGLVTGYETFDTWEIPSKMMSGGDKVDVGEIERNAQALLRFLKYNCGKEEDLSMHWLYKGRGDRIARLWRLEPELDDTLDAVFRDHVMFQHAMLCLGSLHSSSPSPSSNNRYAREQELIDRSLLLLDVCGELGIGQPLRRPLRAALRERLADLKMFSQEPLDVCFNELRLALELLLGEEGEDDGNRMAKRRVLQRGLSWAKRNGEVEFLLQVCGWAESVVDPAVAPLLAECRKMAGERFMDQARSQAQRQEFELAKSTLASAIECFERACNVCKSKPGFFQLGNALNEYGKLLLREGQLGDARLVFSCGVRAFREAGDASNLAVLRCNVAHTFRLGRSRETLTLALDELTAGLAESTSAHWTQCFRREIFNTMVLLAQELHGQEAWQVLNRALLEFASQGEETARAHFHLARLHLPAASAVDAKIAKRHLEQVVALMPNGHVLNAHSRLELADLAAEQRLCPVDHVLKQLLEHFGEDGVELKPKLTSVLCKLLRSSRNKLAYRAVLQEMLHPTKVETSNELLARVRQLML